jgi:hypothetical protein
LAKSEIVSDSLSQRERVGEREKAWLLQNTSEGFHPHPACGHLLEKEWGALGQAGKLSLNIK